MSYTLNAPWTIEERANFVVEHNHQNGRRIVEDENVIYALEPNEMIGDDGLPCINPNYEEEKAQERQALFEQEFFLTSLGYIRRNVNMANGSTKDFICDIVPALQAGLTQGTAAPIITYNQPDFTQDITTEYLVTLQEVKPVTAEFLKECMMQLSNDFMPQGLNITPAEEDTSEAVGEGGEEPLSDIKPEEAINEDTTDTES